MIIIEMITSAINKTHWDHKYDNRWNKNNHYDNRVNSNQRWRSGQYFPTHSILRAIMSIIKTTASYLNLEDISNGTK